MKLPPLSNIGNFFPKLRPEPAQKPDGGRPFRVVQIEVTSRCSTGCIFCPHDALSDRWVEGDIPLELYQEHIVPSLDLFELVYLQGWGEPMLHPQLWEMLHLAQQKGCQTGFTTNGAWLVDEHNQRLLDMGVNLISVSFAGTVAAVHESLRTNSEFDQLCRNFASLANRKQQQNCNLPWLELHFLMTTANMSEFPSLVELGASLGADEVVATNLTYAPTPTLDRMHVFGEKPHDRYLEVIERAEDAAERLGIPLRIYPLHEEPHTLVCDADPLNTIYINHRGEVTPCVYLGLTVQGEIPRYFQGAAHPFEVISFGNVTSGLEQTMRGKNRQSFTAAFTQRNLGSFPLATFTLMAGSDQHELPPVPTPCQHCYKMLGV